MALSRLSQAILPFNTNGDKQQNLHLEYVIFINKKPFKQEAGLPVKQRNRLCHHNPFGWPWKLNCELWAKLTELVTAARGIPESDPALVFPNGRTRNNGRRISLFRQKFQTNVTTEGR